jgi:hypothetical protein
MGMSINPALRCLNGPFFVCHADILSLWEPNLWAIASTPLRQAIAHWGGLRQKTHSLNFVQEFTGPDQ